MSDTEEILTDVGLILENLTSLGSSDTGGGVHYIRCAGPFTYGPIKWTPAIPVRVRGFRINSATTLAIGRVPQKTAQLSGGIFTEFGASELIFWSNDSTVCANFTSPPLNLVVDPRKDDGLWWEVTTSNSASSLAFFYDHWLGN